MLDPADPTRRRCRRARAPRSCRGARSRPGRRQRHRLGPRRGFRRARLLPPAGAGLLRLSPRGTGRLRGAGPRVGRDRDAAVERRRVPDLGPPAGRPAQSPAGAGADLVGADRRGGSGDCLVGGSAVARHASAAARRRRPSRRHHADGVVGLRQCQSVGDGDQRGNRLVGGSVVRRFSSRDVSGMAHRLRLGGARPAAPRRPGLGVRRPRRRPWSWRQDDGRMVAVTRRRATNRRRRLDDHHRGLGRHQRLESVPLRRRRPADRRRRRSGALDVAGTGDDARWRGS